MSLYLATLTELRNELGIPDDTDDALLLALGERIQGRFDAHCQRRFLYSSGEVEFFDGGSRWLMVRRWPISAITDIIVDQDQEWLADDALDASAQEYLVNFARGRITYGSGNSDWPAGMQNIRVRYAGGFVDATGQACAYVDEGDRQALRRAFFAQVAYEWRNRLIMGVNSVSANGMSITTAPSDLLAEVKNTLEPFRRV